MSRHKLPGKSAAPDQNGEPQPGMPFTPENPRGHPMPLLKLRFEEKKSWRKDMKSWEPVAQVFTPIGDPGEMCGGRETSFLMMLPENWGQCFDGKTKLSFLVQGSQTH